MPKSPNELEIEKLTEEQCKAGLMSRSDQLLTIVQVQAAEAQKSAASAAKRNATYMLWSVIAAAISAIITAASVAFNVFTRGPP
jgi:outer membrane protein TolC